MNILVTGVAGFIGMHIAKRLIERGDDVYGIDNLNSYYDQQLKLDRIDQLNTFVNFRFLTGDIADRDTMSRLFVQHPIDRVVHLAAQAGVRYSIDCPDVYVQSNLVGFANLLEGCRHGNISHLVYASSSSVYGASRRLPFSIDDPADSPISLYAATKRSNELMSHVYAHLFGLPCTGLRFFTAYGPWGRPDMAAFSFTKAIFEGRTIRVFNNGNMKRDFTYIDDIVEAIARVLDRPPDRVDCTPPYRLYNVGNRLPVTLLDFIATLERCIGKNALTTMVDIQPGDVQETFADTTALLRDTGFCPSTPIEVGVARFVEWYKAYYKLSIDSAVLPVSA
jgi:UDP-glucuronate 4-epimerase